MIIWGSINDCLRKEKLEVIYTSEILNFSSFEKQKSVFWNFSETHIKRKRDIKKLITSANERSKVNFIRV